MRRSKATSRFRIAFGPEMPDWGSWQWVGADLAQAFGERASTFKPWQQPDADVAVVVKHLPPREWIDQVSRRSALIYCPVDCYGAEEEIRADSEFLSRCARIVVHCHRLIPLFAPFAPCSYLDHHVKFAAPLRRKFKNDGPILWVGVRSNLGPLVEWVNAHPLPAPLVVLTNLERPDQPIDAKALGFRDESTVTVQHWSPEAQRSLTSSARAVIDIKGQDFRSRHKPPAKAIDFVASGVPLAMNPESSSVEHFAKLGLDVPSPLDVNRWLSKQYWQKTQQLGRKLRRQLTVQVIAQHFEQLAAKALTEQTSATISIPAGTVEKTDSTRPTKPDLNNHRSPELAQAVEGLPRLYGLLITKDDHEAFADWCRHQLPLYDAVVCLDGSESAATERLAMMFGERLVYLHERDFEISHKTDHGLRRVVHREIVSRFGPGHWVMCCHVDEYCYHDPRAMAGRAEREGFDQVSWFSPHFYPHPDEIPNWPQLRLSPVPERFHYYHWSYQGDGFPWLEDRLYRAPPGVEWDHSTHGYVRPHGLRNPAPFHPIFRHFKVLITDPEWYERQPDAAHYRHHWQGLEHRTGLPYSVQKFEDLFVRSVPKYTRCDRFTGSFDQPWNIGDELRATSPLVSSPDERQHARAGDLAIAGNLADSKLLLETLDRNQVPARLRGLARNDLAVLAAIRGEAESARDGFRSALEIDLECSNASQNLALLEETLSRSDASTPALPASRAEALPQRVKVAVLSLLFNWPSTGGGNIHTAELTRFLALGGFEVRHVYARFEPWGIGTVTSPTPFPSESLEFSESEWNARTIQDRFRQAVDAFSPDYVILTDSWNFKPLLAQAVRNYPFIMRLQALECLCPLNNVRLLPEPGGRVRQCPLQQLATPDACLKCLGQRGHQSGPLHQAERELSGVGSPEYAKILKWAFAEAEAVLVVNPLTEAMVSPFAKQVCVVTSGMDPARFPWPAPTRVSKEKKVILFAGLTHEWMKGFHVARMACAQLWAKRQDFELVATSEPDLQGEPFVRYVGWQSQDQLPSRLYECDILVIPTLAQEALARTAVEAMAAGKPVVASRLGGLPFTVVEGATGLLVEPGDLTDLARKIETLLDDCQLRSQLGQAGRRRFEDHYAWPVIIERYYRPLLLPRHSLV